MIVPCKTLSEASSIAHHIELLNRATREHVVFSVFAIGSWLDANDETVHLGATLAERKIIVPKKALQPPFMKTIDLHERRTNKQLASYKLDESTNDIKFAIVMETK